MRALRIAATGMAAQQTNVEVISQNIANMNTVGYKAQRAEFEDLVYENVVRPGAQSSDTGTVVPTGIQLGSGVKTASVYRIMTQGAMTQTGNQLDVAVNGRGYLQVLLPSGDTAYTRAGNLSVNDQGQVVTADGYQVIPQITIPQNSTGRDHLPVRPGAGDPARPGRAPAGRPDAARHLLQRGGLEAIGNNLFLQSGSSGQPVTGTPNSTGFGYIQQGYTEASNVDPVSEISSLIVAQRAYEMNSKVVTSADQMLQTTNQMKS